MTEEGTLWRTFTHTSNKLGSIFSNLFKAHQLMAKDEDGNDGDGDDDRGRSGGSDGEDKTPEFKRLFVMLLT